MVRCCRLPAVRCGTQVSVEVENDLLEEGAEWLNALFYAAAAFFGT